MKFAFSTKEVRRNSFLDLCKIAYDYGYAGFELYDALTERKNLLVVIDRANDVAALSVRNLAAVHVLYVDQLNTDFVLVSPQA